MNHPLSIRLIHRRFNRERILKAHPLVCNDSTLTLTWETPPQAELFDTHELKELFLTGEGEIIKFIPLLTDLQPNKVVVELPEYGVQVNRRGSTRGVAKDIQTRVIQNGSSFSGDLIDFSSTTLKTTLTPSDDTTLRCLNKEEPLTLSLSQKGHILYSGECRVMSIRKDHGVPHYILSPLKNNIRRYQSKEFRGQRSEPSDPLYIRFTHPLSNQSCEIRIKNLSGSGFALEQPSKNGLLMAGLRLNEVEILLPGGNPLGCEAQIIHSGVQKQSQITGIAIINMDPAEHTQLLNYLHQIRDPHSFIGGQLDLNDLWGFFFESGFLYPNKYSHLTTHKQKIHDLYEKLYHQTPALTRHFIHREGREIQGHIAMLRSYENSWLLHHHASRRENNGKAGLHVLNQVGSFGNNCHRINSLHMDYLMCYFQKSNSFPRKVFGDIADKIGDKNSCSLDEMNYIHIPAPQGAPPTLPQSWSLGPANEEELEDLSCVYDEYSQGLMLDALHLRAGNTPNSSVGTNLSNTDNSSLSAVYGKAKIYRDIQLVALRNNGIMNALIMVDRSETGINLSDLTNGLKVFVIEPNLPLTILKDSLSHLSGAFQDSTEVPTLIYPSTYGIDQGLEPEKKYTLWVINMEASDKYFRYLKLMLRFASH